MFYYLTGGLSPMAWMGLSSSILGPIALCRPVGPTCIVPEARWAGPSRPNSPILPSLVTIWNTYMVQNQVEQRCKWIKCQIMSFLSLKLIYHLFQYKMSFHVSKVRTTSFNTQFLYYVILDYIHMTINLNHEKIAIIMQNFSRKFWKFICEIKMSKNLCILRQLTIYIIIK